MSQGEQHTSTPETIEANMEGRGEMLFSLQTRKWEEPPHLRTNADKKLLLLMSQR